MAYPGSPLYQNAKSDGKKLPTEYSQFSQHSYDTLNLANGNLSSAEILSFRDEAWKKCHDNVDYHKLLKENLKWQVL